MKATCILLLCALGTATSVAYADSFSFSAAGSGFSGSGVITASPSGTSGVDNITGITGQINGSAIQGLAVGTPSTLGPYQFINYFSVGSANYGIEFDNLYFTSGAPLDSYGVGFTLANGSAVNLYETNGTFFYINPSNYTAADVNNPTPGQPAVTADFAPVPEPSSLLLLGTGTLAAAAFLRRRTLA